MYLQLGVRKYFLLTTQRHLLGQGLLITDASCSHSRHTTLGRSPLDEWSARRRDLYLTVHNTQNSRETSIPPAGFEPALPASEQPQSHALDRAKTGICHKRWHYRRIYLRPKFVLHFSLASPVGTEYFSELSDLRQQEMCSAIWQRVYYLQTTYVAEIALDPCAT